MNKVALIYICTWNYDVFWNDFYHSSKKYFLPECKRHYFVFSDSTNINAIEDIALIKKEPLEWPFSAFAKFEYILSIEKELCDFDYVFLFNANTIFVRNISNKEILPSKDYKICGVKHIGFQDKNILDFPYERNNQSRAYIKYGLWKHYFFSATSWWYTSDYLKLCRTCQAWIDEDMANGVVAIWHDESFINRYFYENDDILLKLEPKYWYPEFTLIPIQNPSIIYSSKERYWWWSYLRKLGYEYKKIDKMRFQVKMMALSTIYWIWKKIGLRKILRFLNLLK